MKQCDAGVAELADAYGSGPYGGNPMKVQVLSPAPFKYHQFASLFWLAFLFSGQAADAKQAHTDAGARTKKEQEARCQV